jgi:hypothetical protein
MQEGFRAQKFVFLHVSAFLSFRLLCSASVSAAFLILLFLLHLLITILHSVSFFRVSHILLSFPFILSLLILYLPLIFFRRLALLQFSISLSSSTPQCNVISVTCKLMSQYRYKCYKIGKLFYIAAFH